MHILKVSGKATIPQPLTLEQDVELGVKGSVVKIEYYDNQDGTKDVRYVVKPVTIEVDYQRQ